MAILFFILIVTGLYHYFLENVIVPYRMLRAESKLLKLKAELHALKKDNSKIISNSSYHTVQSLIDITLFLFQDNYIFHLVEKIPLRKVRTSAQKEKGNRISHLEIHPDERIRMLIKEYLECIESIRRTHYLGLLTYLLPILLPYFIINKLFIKSSVEAETKKLNSVIDSANYIYKVKLEEGNLSRKQKQPAGAFAY